jgi:YihY family inner membrane protein
VTGYVARTSAVVRDVAVGVRSERITFLAAGLAYYALISLLPLLLLALVVTSYFGGSELVEALVSEASRTLGEEIGSAIRQALTGAAGRSGATILGLAVLLWSGLKLFRGLDIAFSEVYGDPGPASILEQLQHAVITLSAVGVAVAATVVIGVIISLLGVGPIIEGRDTIGIVGNAILIGGLTVAFLPLYYVLPGPRIAVREALPGALLAGIGWTALQTGFRIYAGIAGSYEAYGILGGVLLLVTFLYFGGLILLLGVVLNAVVAGRSDGRPKSEPSRPEPTTVLEGIMTHDRPDDDASAEELREELEELYEEFDRFEGRIDERTVHREEIETDLKRYVRARIRRGKARGWGPYLVLLYGTAMTLGAFYFLEGGWAVLAMLVIWLSTLGLYTLMLVIGTTVTIAGLPGRLKDRFKSR